MAKVATKTFQDILQEKMGNSTVARAHTQRLQDELKVAQNFQSQEDQKVTRLNRIAWMSTWENVMEWQRKDTEAPIPGQDYAWRYWHTLETSTLYFTVAVYERTDRKRDKFVVQVRGTQRELSGRHKEIQGGYTYNVEKYGSKDIIDEASFRTKEDAEMHAKTWMKRIYEDFKERIDWDREMRDLCIASGFMFAR